MRGEVRRSDATIENRVDGSVDVERESGTHRSGGFVAARRCVLYGGEKDQFEQETYINKSQI